LDRGALGKIGQAIAEVVTGGSPRSFLPELPSRARLTVDIYLPRTDHAVEVKTGGSKLREHQVAHYQRAGFTGGFSVMFVQNPSTGEIGPGMRDYLILTRRGIPYSQVWFTGVALGKVPSTLKKSQDAKRATNPTPQAMDLPGVDLPFGLILRSRRGLRGVVLHLLSSTPMNGTQIMKEVESLTNGNWRPKAGSVYPLLRDMLERGDLVRTKEGDKYELSPEVKAEFQKCEEAEDSTRASISTMVAEFQMFVAHMEDLKESGREELESYENKLRELARRLDRLSGEEGAQESTNS